MLSTLARAPVLFTQGIYVKLKTPKLPEAGGERKGCVDVSKINETFIEPMRLMIVGDSAAAGVGVADQCDALSGQLVQTLSAHMSVQWRLEAQSGLNTRELIDFLSRQTSDPVDAVIVSLGVNDVLSNTRPESFIKYQRQLIELLLQSYQARTVMLTSVPPMGRFPALPKTLRGFLGARADALNEALPSLEREYEQVHVLSLSLPIEASYFASDGFHPNEKAYKLWAKSVAQKLLLLRELNP